MLKPFQGFLTHPGRPSVQPSNVCRDLAAHATSRHGAARCCVHPHTGQWDECRLGLIDHQSFKQVGRVLKTNHHIFWRELNQNKSLEQQYSNILHHLKSLTTNIWRKKNIAKHNWQTLIHFDAPPSTNQGHWCYVFHHHLSTSHQLNQPEHFWVQGEMQKFKNPGLESRPPETIE